MLRWNRAGPSSRYMCDGSTFRNDFVKTFAGRFEVVTAPLPDCSQIDIKESTEEPAGVLAVRTVESPNFAVEKILKMFPPSISRP